VSGTVEYAVEGAIARIHLNRPERLNAVVPQLVDDLLGALARADAEGVRAVVLAGRGRAFCAGHDLKEPAPTDGETAMRARVERIQDVTRSIRAMRAPVVAAVHGYALGAGAEFALGCDLVVAAEDASLGFPEVGVGLSVTGGISLLLPRLVGLARAKELLMIGRHLPAEEALTLGLVNGVVPTGAHEVVAGELAAELAARPPHALGLAKSLLDSGIDGSFEDALEREVDAAIATTRTGEATEAATAFRESHGG
jgi:enoyl-CoA hydratase/carnithine racemase